jgi:hypothetical protein
MKTMRVLLGAASVMALLSGCGGASPCEEMRDSFADALKRVGPCAGGREPTQEEIDEAFDLEACEEGMKEECTDKQAERVASFMSCALDKLTCQNFGDSEAYQEEVMACAEEGSPNLDCFAAMTDQD